jgi:hypothetical protein
MFSSEARVPTSVPARYLGQLCKHFAHKVPVEYTAEHGRLEFPFGTCVVEAESDLLVLRADAQDEPSLRHLEEVIARHLERFAFREKPEIRWTRTAR